ncbi:MAG: hypothetical protein IPL86_07310 [Flavobacteriales bacterium]|nr:hypothetical protein [Flavobacteriales bacterium]
MRFAQRRLAPDDLRKQWTWAKKPAAKRGCAMQDQLHQLGESFSIATDMVRDPLDIDLAAVSK